MSKYFLLLLIFCCASFAQTETQRWKAEKNDYRLDEIKEKDASINTSDIPTTFVSVLQVTYYKLFSDYDGDNCPFHPSCSAFFVEAVDTTNTLQGSLMFADRFTRDLNFFKTLNSYPIHKSGKFYDPAHKYAFIPSTEQKENLSDD